MEKISNKIKALPPGQNYFSLEFFPPKTSTGTANLRARLERMSRALCPLFVTVTWGAGGATASKSLDLAAMCQRDLGLTTCLHLTCTNVTQEFVDGVLERAYNLGIRNILALRGDPPRQEFIKNHSDTKDTVEFERAIDLVSYIKAKYGDYFCVGVAAYPEGHADRENPDEQNLMHDLPYLVDKVNAGADFIMTQLFFDVKAYDHFEKVLREHDSGCFKDLPIIPGIMPIQSYQTIKRTIKLAHARIPPEFMARLDSVRSDDALVKQRGVDIVSEIVTHIKHTPSSAPGTRGFHFYTLNLEKAVALILQRTSLIPSSQAIDELESNRNANSNECEANTNGTCPQDTRQATNSVDPDLFNRVVITESKPSDPQIEATIFEASALSKPDYSRAATLAIIEGEGSLGRDATRDDFVNGRWGDSQSPAYGMIDGSCVILHMSRKQAIELWGYPSSIEEVTSIFLRHIEGSISAIPWSEDDLCHESEAIKVPLRALNRKGWWTVASQPPVNGISSQHPIFGWGPPRGFVFQKAFIEFFLPSAAWSALRAKLESSSIAPDVSWYACNAHNVFKSSNPTINTSSEMGRTSRCTNAVAWGVFPGREIITPTIIEEVSLRSWAEEAFSIWSEWARICAESGSKSGKMSREFLEGVYEDLWLVNIIHHDYFKEDALWDILLE
ncbi:hypothetical protein BGHDH14_bgh01143 [Blumeria hordei DH14]|uniref:MTHFR SAM-binding regulatory domain-containing protein n=1 Tax=Blumeria graminis f. sp. hordei (strain DH14) TaxID=546991 RepID=N1JE16_BLUG1|nr:hypothetical protein BGHDH14_bgh01143 [Blumeria hordei DH14]